MQQSHICKLVDAKFGPWLPGPEIIASVELASCLKADSVNEKLS